MCVSCFFNDFIEDHVSTCLYHLYLRIHMNIQRFLCHPTRTKQNNCSVVLKGFCTAEGMEQRALPPIKANSCEVIIVGISWFWLVHYF